MQLPDPVMQVVKEVGDVKIHVFISPEMFLANSTWVIEGPNEVVVVDGQFVVPQAQWFRGYVNSLLKPINRIYISHEHPDHFFGVSGAFPDVPAYALQETIDFLAANGEAIRADRQKVYGGFVPEALVIPQHAVAEGREIIDGVTFEHVKVHHAEVDTQLVINLPDLGISIVQDLVYSGGHVYIHSLDSSGWIAVLEDMAANGPDLFLAGHGGTADRAEVQANADYLKAATKLAASATDVESFKAALLAAYPDRKAAAIIDIYAPLLLAAKA
jgi:glyoxylase-like metal-dependent hydrolase (beta-lactamase superfamily II)